MSDEATDTNQTTDDITTSNEPSEPQAKANILSEMECRILGALMEKQLSTPDAYPLTVKSLMSAANQKSSREPVTNYQQGELVRALRELEARRLVRYEMGARSERYEQRFTHEFNLSKKQQALMAVMMLRGPQAPHELMTRTQRLYEFTDREDMMVSLERLTQGSGAIAVAIPRQSGQRDDRYGHILCGEIQITAAVTVPTRNHRTQPASTDELETLKSEVATLRRQLDKLYELTGQQIPDNEETTTLTE